MPHSSQAAYSAALLRQLVFCLQQLLMLLLLPDLQIMLACLGLQRPQGIQISSSLLLSPSLSLPSSLPLLSPPPLLLLVLLPESSELVCRSFRICSHQPTS